MSIMKDLADYMKKNGTVTGDQLKKDLGMSSRQLTDATCELRRHGFDIQRSFTYTYVSGEYEEKLSLRGEILKVISNCKGDTFTTKELAELFDQDDLDIHEACRGLHAGGRIKKGKGKNANGKQVNLWSAV